MREKQIPSGKIASVAEIKEKFEKAKGAVIADYRGLNVGEVTELRSKMRKEGIELRVLKNTLTKIAVVDQLGYADMEQYLEGPTAVAFGYEDAVAPAKILQEFLKTHKKMSIKAGFIEGKVVDAEGVKTIASLPPKEVLLAMLLGGMKSPISGLVGALSGVPRNLVYVLDSIKKQKEAI